MFHFGAVEQITNVNQKKKRCSETSKSKINQIKSVNEDW